MKTVIHKGYQASVEFDNGALYVKVLHIDDILIAECEKASEVEAAAQNLIDEYLKDCAEEGREPAKPYRGSFNVRIPADMHKRLAMAAAEASMTQNAWVGKAIEEKLECSKFAERMDGVISSSRKNFNNQIANIFTYWQSEQRASHRMTTVEPKKNLTWLGDVDTIVHADFVNRTYKVAQNG